MSVGLRCAAVLFAASRASTTATYSPSESLPADGTTAPADDQAAELELRGAFARFKRNFGKKYSGEREEKLRLRAFSVSKRSADDLNRATGAAVFGTNYFSDLLENESSVAAPKGLILGNLSKFDDLKVAPMGALLLGPSARGEAAADHLNRNLPPAIDWRLANVVTPVKTQGSCGACWAFSVAQEVESMYALHVVGASMEVFSPQQITSCAPDGVGCGGGDPISGYTYLMEAEGLAQEVFWPFAGGLTPSLSCDAKSCTQPCDAKDLAVMKKYSTLIGPYARVTDASFATPFCKDGLCQKQDLGRLAHALVERGPIAIAVNAERWHQYAGGIMTFESCGGSTMFDLDHAVQLVGFHTRAPVPYWIVRNTWSTLWGEAGYIYLEYGRNTCGLANLATFPEVAAGRGGGPGQHVRRLAESIERAEQVDRLRRLAIGEGSSSQVQEGRDRVERRRLENSDVLV